MTHLAEQSGCTVLVVEDEATIRLMLVDELEDTGFEVIEAENADIAIAKLKRNLDIRAVVTDVRMPGSMDGLGLANWMREHRDAIPIVITSGFSTSPDIGSTLPSVVKVIAKPYRPQDVANCLADIVAQREPLMAHVWQPENLRRAVEAAGVSLWAWKVDDDRFSMDKQGFGLWGIPWSRSITFEELSQHIHPADRDRVRAGFTATRAVLGPYETDFRIVVGDDVRWIAARGQGQDVGMVGRTMFGIFLDVTGRKQAEEGHELLAGEMSHRVKNLLAIAAALAEITSRSTATTTDMVRELSQRLTALGRAHDLVRPPPGGQGKAALMGDLLAVLLAPYDDEGAFSGRIRVAVERMGLGEAAATSLA
jgi:CheY-like chemotaxis protein